MLRATRRLLKPGGRIACLIIEVGEGLDPRARRRANLVGPRCIATSSTYPSMFKSAGLVDVERIDCTDDYHRTATAWLAERERNMDSLRALMGEQTYEEKVSEGHATIEAIERGMLRRFLYVASRRA